MEPKEIFTIAFSALRANKVRSALTMLGVVIGVASVILLMSIGSGLKTYITKQLEDLGADSVMVMPGNIDVKGGSGGGIQGAGSASPKFTFDNIEDLKKSSKFERVMAHTESNGTLKFRGNTHTTQVVGTGAEYPILRNQKTVEGKFFTTAQYEAAKKVVVLGKTVAKDLFSQQGAVGQKITLSGQTYSVIGVLEEKGAFGNIDMDNQAFIPATTAMRQFDLEHIMAIWVQAKNSSSVEAAKKEVENILLKRLKKEDFSVLDTKSILNVVSNVLGVLTIALGGIGAISLLVGGIGIMNIMLVSVTERTKEIGLRKAIGATPKNIMSQFLLESAALSLSGGIVGIAIAVAGTIVIRRFISAEVTLWSVIMAFSVSALVGITFGVAPAVKAAKLNPIDALRYE